MVDAKVIKVVPFDFSEEEENKSDDAITDDDADYISIVQGITCEIISDLTELLTIVMGLGRPVISSHALEEVLSRSIK